MVAKGKKGWSDGSASRQKRQDVLLRLKWRSVSLWSATIQHVAGDADEGRTVRVQARYDRRGIRIMEVGKPHTMVTLLWCLLLIVLPITLVFSESSMNNIQSVSIISAFPIGIIMILMIWSFFKDAKKYREEKGIK